MWMRQVVASYSLPAYNPRRGGPGLGRRPAPTPPPAPLIKSPATDLETLDDTPIEHRKRSFSSLASFLHRLLLSVPSQPDRPHDLLHHHRTRSTASTASTLLSFTALTTTAFVAPVLLFASQGTPHAPELLRPCRTPRPSRLHMHIHIPPG